MSSTRLAAGAAFALTAALGACGGDGGATAPGPVATIAVTPNASTLASIGEQVTLTATARDAAGRAVTGKSFTWVTSASAVAGVSDAGVVTAWSNGTATITATTDGVSGGTTVTVHQTPARLAFVIQPAEALIGATMAPVNVEIRDARDNAMSNASNVVTLALGANPSGATLTSAFGTRGYIGIVFYPLSIDREGSGYTLVATSPGLQSATSTPFNVVALRLRAVSAGGLSCGIATDDAVWCWGLGYGDSGIPQRATGNAKFASVSVGDVYVCGIALDATAYCWGSLVPPYDPLFRDTYVPTAVSGGLKFASVSSGLVHVCGVTTDHHGYCWGSNSQAELGAPTTQTCDGSPCSRAPVLVSGNLLFASIAVGEGFSCGLTTTGSLYCWGANDNGQMGNGSSARSQAAPTLISSSLSWSTVTAGQWHACAIATTGDTYCWGNNQDGEIGSGTFGPQPTPALVAGGQRFVALDLGDWFSCGLTGSGAAYCWGANSNTQLGDGTQQSHPTPAPVSGGHLFVALSAGRMHSCALTTQNVAYCWGYGPLGDGRMNGVGLSPVRVLGQP
jgi:alpha-tubulin suppressor-like RCC1 family protein